MELHTILKASYAKGNDQKNMLAKYGYQYDNKLSNQNQQIYYNPAEHKLLNTVAGTHNLADVGTDIYLAVGRLKDTNRYKEADRTLKSAKEKYKPVKTIVAGQSLGGAIAGYIGSNNDDIYTLNKGATIGQKVKSNEKAYRTQGDIISLANANSKNMKTLKTDNNTLLANVLKTTALSGANPFLGVAYGIRSGLNSHSVDSIKNSRIRV